MHSLDSQTQARWKHAFVYLNRTKIFFFKLSSLYKCWSAPKKKKLKYSVNKSQYKLKILNPFDAHLTDAMTVFDRRGGALRQTTDQAGLKRYDDSTAKTFFSQMYLCLNVCERHLHRVSRKNSQPDAVNVGRMGCPVFRKPLTLTPSSQLAVHISWSI